MSKEIRLVRPVRVTVNGVTHELNAGWQTVDQEVADNWMVKALTDNHSSDAQPDTRDAQIMELSSQIGVLKGDLVKAQEASANAVVNENKVIELTDQLAAMTQARDNLQTDFTAMSEKAGAAQVQIDAFKADAAAKEQTTTESSKAKHK